MASIAKLKKGFVQLMKNDLIDEEGIFTLVNGGGGVTATFTEKEVNERIGQIKKLSDLEELYEEWMFSDAYGFCEFTDALEDSLES